MSNHKLNFSLASTNFEQATTELMVLPVFSTKDTVTTIKCTTTLEQWVQTVSKSENFTAKVGQVLFIRQTDQPWQRVLLVGMGQQDKLNNYDYLKSLAAIKTTLLNTAASETQIALTNCTVTDASNPDIASQTARIIQSFFYEYQHVTKGRNFKPSIRSLQQVNFINITQTDDAIITNKINEGAKIATGMMTTQNVANMPPNYCTPTELAATAQKLAESKHTTVQILELDTCKKMGMGAFYSVAKGSTEPAKFIILEYKHPQAKQKSPLALVGKGVTFDTGGISLKPGNTMDEMKFDMCGAATVLGTLSAVQQLELALNLVCVIPATENMPAGNATKPGDVVVSLSGQTIEVLNTDAEGRMILCDALTYVQREYKPSTIIDMATLTGACIVALGHEQSAILGNNDALCTQLFNAGVAAQDLAWRLPLHPIYDSQLHSNFADMANIGGRAGTITAAAFLARFIENDTPWAHLDIAGTAWHTGKAKGASGRPVPLLVNYLVQQQ